MLIIGNSWSDLCIPSTPTNLDNSLEWNPKGIRTLFTFLSSNGGQYHRTKKPNKTKRNKSIENLNSAVMIISDTIPRAMYPLMNFESTRTNPLIYLLVWFSEPLIRVFDLQENIWRENWILAVSWLKMIKMILKKKQAE